MSQKKSKVSDRLADAYSDVLDHAIKLAAKPAGSKSDEREYVELGVRALTANASPQQLATLAVAAIYESAKLRRQQQDLISVVKAHKKMVSELVETASTAKKALSGDQHSVRKSTNGRGLRRGTLISDLLAVGTQIGKKTTAQSGGKARSAPYVELKKHAVGLFREGKFKSARQAKEKLFNQVNQYGRTLGTPLSEDSGPDTLYKWFLEAAREDKRK